MVMSCTKGATALCAHLLASAGELDFDEPVATYWPEFAAAGKEAVLVRHLLNHQAGLPALREPVPAGGFYDWDDIVAPPRRPRSRSGSRALATATTPSRSGSSSARWCAACPASRSASSSPTEVAGPLGLDLYIGLPASEHARVATCVPPAAARSGRPDPRFYLAGDDRPDFDPRPRARQQRWLPRARRVGLACRAARPCSPPSGGVDERPVAGRALPSDRPRRHDRSVHARARGRGPHGRGRVGCIPGRRPARSRSLDTRLPQGRLNTPRGRSRRCGSRSARTPSGTPATAARSASPTPAPTSRSPTS